MGLEDYVLTIALGGAFAIGLMFIVMRREAQVNLQSGMSAEGLLTQHSGMGFGKAKKSLDRKLAAVQDLLRQQNVGDRQLAEERFNRRRNDQAEAEEEARRQRELEAARVQSELDEARERQEEEAARRAAERDAEEARLAAEQEAERQAEMADAEEQRLAEIEAARQEEMLESRQAAQRAMSELRARLEREGAQSSDVQISLMWNNYNDLDLHVVCPSGERIHGGNKKSACGGELDVDANVRAETRKPIENVFWEEGKAPAGRYQVYVHYYKKHKKRRSKDPTKFQVIVNEGGDPREYNGELSAGDPIASWLTLPYPPLRKGQSVVGRLKKNSERPEWMCRNPRRPSPKSKRPVRPKYRLQNPSVLLRLRRRGNKRCSKRKKPLSVRWPSFRLVWSAKAHSRPTFRFH